MNHTGLCSLVDELLLAIIEQIDEKQALCSLAATCSRFRDLAEPYIWHSLLVLNGRQAYPMAHAFSSCPDRLSKIRKLALHYKHHDADGIGSLNSFIRHMTELRHLTIESPCPNNGEWRYEGQFTAGTRIDYMSLFGDAVQYSIPDRPLQKLQSLTLHGHGTGHDKFKLGRAASIFLHPTITNITISCINFEMDSDVSNSIYFPATALKTTALRSLKFVESNIYLEVLDIILGLPKALKELYLGERLFSWDDCRLNPDKPNTAHPLLLDALQKQADSLERLSHTGGRFSLNRTPAGVNGILLQNLKHLEYLKVDESSILLTALTADGCPERLKTVKIVDESRANSPLNALLPLTTFPFCQFLGHIHSSLTKISHSINVEACFSHHSSGNDLLETLTQLWESQRIRSLVYDTVNLLKSRNARFEIFAENFPGGTAFIEPYMYGEERPIEVPVYSSDDMWTFVGVDYQNSDEGKLESEHSTENNYENFNVMYEVDELELLLGGANAAG